MARKLVSSDGGTAMEGLVIWILSGALLVVIIVLLVRAAMKSGVKLEMPKTTQLDIQDALHPDEDD